MKPTKSPYLTRKKSGIHNYGMFAKKDIPKGTRVIEYVGEKITKKEAEKRGIALIEKAEKTKEGAVYLFDLNKRYDVDGNVSYNTARFINHSCEPNCIVEIIRGRIWIVADRDIKKGEEVSYNYGYDLDCYEDHLCQCGTQACVGYIVSEDDWPKLKKLLAKLKKRQK